MPLTFVEVVSNTASVTLKVGDNSLTVFYFPSKITEETYAQLQLFGNMTQEGIQGSFAALNEMLCELIQSWDFYENAEQTVMVPLIPERLAKVPIFLRMAVLDAIMGDIRPETLAPSIQS